MPLIRLIAILVIVVLAGALACLGCYVFSHHIENDEEAISNEISNFLDLPSEAKPSILKTDRQDATVFALFSSPKVSLLGVSCLEEGTNGKFRITQMELSYNDSRFFSSVTAAYKQHQIFYGNANRLSKIVMDYGADSFVVDDPSSYSFMHVTSDIDLQKYEGVKLFDMNGNAVELPREAEDQVRYMTKTNMTLYYGFILIALLTVTAVGIVLFCWFSRQKRAHIIALSLALTSCCLISGCAPAPPASENAPTQKVKVIEAEYAFSVEGDTMLERLYEDIDNDGEEESIEMYSSAELMPDGLMGWSSGHYWKLIVRKDDAVFPLFKGWLRYGDVQIWIAAMDQNTFRSSETVGLSKDIYAIIFENTFEIFLYRWNEKDMVFERTTVLNPSGQQYIRHNQQHMIPNAIDTDIT